MGEPERVYLETGPDPRSLNIPQEQEPEPEPEVQVMQEDMVERERIHKRIQVEIQNENQETRVRAEEMLEIPPEWNEVPDLIMEEGDILPENMRPEKWKREEIS